MATPAIAPTVQPSISKKTTAPKGTYPRTITFKGPKKPPAAKKGKRATIK